MRVGEELHERTPVGGVACGGCPFPGDRTLTGVAGLDQPGGLLGRCGRESTGAEVLVDHLTAPVGDLVGRAAVVLVRCVVVGTQFGVVPLRFGEPDDVSTAGLFQLDDRGVESSVLFEGGRGEIGERTDLGFECVDTSTGGGNGGHGENLNR